MGRDVADGRVVVPLSGDRPGVRVLIGDPHRLDSVQVLGVAA